jgi:zinc/manganese transport system substrate-binding protein
MKRLLIVLFICGLALTGQCNINVVSTLPDGGAIARDIGGTHVTVSVLAKPNENPHFVSPRPTFVVDLRTANVLIENGGELEVAWLPPLLQKAGNAKIAVGQPGRVIAAEDVRLSNVPGPARAAANVHPLGNPHFMTDPIVATAVAQHIARALSKIDPLNSADYQANYQKFESTMNFKMKQWRRTLSPCKGAKFAAYHDSWSYFAHRFAIDVDIFLEPEPGVPPSPAHLAEVIDQIKAQHIKGIIVEPYQDRKIAEKVASATDVKIIDFAQFPGGLSGTDSYTKLIDQLVTNILRSTK